MKTFTIEIEAKTDGDADLAIAEVARLIESGYLSGANENESGSFRFSSSGEFEQDTIWVVGYVGESTGGFEWSYDSARTDIQRREWLADGDCDVSDIQCVVLDELELSAGCTAEEITKALDRHPDIWEPAAKAKV